MGARRSAASRGSFGLPDKGYEVAWKFLMDGDHFLAEFGPTTVERKDPMFHLEPTCCWWSGQSWPYATAQTLKAMANLSDGVMTRNSVTKADYYKLLRTYALTHRKDGKPYLAEAANPDTGSFKAMTGYNHSEHYFHSSYCDRGDHRTCRPEARADDVVEVNPLAPLRMGLFRPR